MPLATQGVFCYTGPMGVYSRHAPAYVKAGFTPMPWAVFDGGKKAPLVKGYLQPNPPVGSWIKDRPNGQIGIVADGWIGIDVDSSEHDGKSGEKTILKLEESLGALPRTLSSTARGENSISRIYFYRIPKDDRRYRDVGPDVESIRPGHRYAAVYPSIHPSGEMYRWYNADGSVREDIPSVYEFASLPETWLEYLTSVAKTQAFYSGSIPLWKSKLVEGEMGQEIVNKLLETESEFGHTDLIRILSWLADKGAAGEPGIMEAFSVVRENFTRPPYNTARFETEFEQALEWAIRNAGGEGVDSPEDTFNDVMGRWSELTNPEQGFDKGDLAMSLKLFVESLTSDFTDKVKSKYKRCLELLDKVETEDQAKTWITKTRQIMKKEVNG